MAVNSKQKGNKWERDLANLLSKRFAAYLGVEKGFIRKPDSGSYFGGTNVSRTETHLAEFQTFGDILCPKSFKWTIEAKHYKTPFSLNSILLQKNTQLDEWIVQAEQDAEKALRSPLIIIKFNNCEPFVLTERCGYSPAGVEHEPVFAYGKYDAYLLKTFFAPTSDAVYFYPG